MDDDRQNERMAHKLKNGTVDRSAAKSLADLPNDPGWMVAVRESSESLRVNTKRQHNDNEGSGTHGSHAEDIVAAIVPAGKGCCTHRRPRKKKKIMAMIQRPSTKPKRKTMDEETVYEKATVSILWNGVH
jgi:hypothetical protein